MNWNFLTSFQCQLYQLVLVLAAPVKNEEGHAEAEPDADKDQLLLRGIQDFVDDVQTCKNIRVALFSIRIIGSQNQTQLNQRLHLKKGIADTYKKCCFDMCVLTKIHGTFFVALSSGLQCTAVVKYLLHKYSMG